MRGVEVRTLSCAPSGLRVEGTDELHASERSAGLNSPPSASEG